MTTQGRIFFSALALAFAAGASGVACAQGAESGGAAATQSQPQSPPAAVGGGASGMSGGAVQAQAGNDILNMKAGEISGREVYNSQGKELGKVDMIGRDRTTGDLSAILSVGGFLGFGGSKVAIPIDQFSFQEDKLILSTVMSKKELRQQASGYQSKRYEAVAEDTTLSQVAPITGGTAAAGAAGQSQGSAAPQGQAQPPSATGGISFQQYDANRDGYISRDEASRDPTLLGHWQVLDRNNDGRIDTSEFSAFEQSSSEPRPSGDNMRQRESPSMPSER